MDTGRVGTRSAEAASIQRVEHSVARILAETDRPVEAYGADVEDPAAVVELVRPFA